MLRRTRWIGGGAIVLAVIGTGTGIAIATGTDQDTPIAGSDLDKATAAALEATGGGSVIETEVGDDGVAYGVEIRLGDGGVVEVGLDGDFNVISSEPDDDGPGEHAGANDD
jgi:uncharacterized membrane protein YkoI